MRIFLWLLVLLVIVALLHDADAKRKKNKKKKKLKKKMIAEVGELPVKEAEKQSLLADRPREGGAGTEREREVEREKKEICRRRNRRRLRRGKQPISCETVDQIQDALFCVNKKIAQDKGLAVPRRGEVSPMLGDIILTPGQAEELASSFNCSGKIKGRRRRRGGRRRNRSKRDLAVGLNQIWPGPTVHWRLNPSNPPTLNTGPQPVAIVSGGQLVGGNLKDALDFYEQNTCIDFVPWTGQTNFYLDFVHGGGCSSWVGRFQSSGNPGQEITLNPGCWPIGTVEHEIGHALGLLHKQSRLDRDTFVQILFGNIQGGASGNFAPCSGSNCRRDYQYDFGSMMHYGRFAFTVNSQPTVNSLDTRFRQTYGFRNSHMDFLDLKYINNIYCGVESSNGPQLGQVCGAGSAVCLNGGYPNPSPTASCQTCHCPDHLQGNCADRFQGTPNACGSDEQATSTVQSISKTGFVAGEKCAWIITSPAGTQIDYNITSLNIPSGSFGTNPCWHSFLEIREGESSQFQNGLANTHVDFTNTGFRYCGSSTPAQSNGRTLSNKLVIIFRDIDASASSGQLFNINYNCFGANCDGTPVNCAFTWNPWSACSTTCGAGTQIRTPNISQQPMNGGTACPNPETRPCNPANAPCPTPVDCQWTWGAWSTCTTSCGDTGTQTRNIIISRPSSGGGQECPPSPETRECNRTPCPCTGASCNREISLRTCCFYRVSQFYSGQCPGFFQEQTLTSFPATFTSPNYPGQLPYYLYCYFRLSSENASDRLRLTVTDIGTEDYYDRVYLRESNGGFIANCLNDEDCEGDTFDSNTNSMVVWLHQLDRYKAHGEIGFSMSVEHA